MEALAIMLKGNHLLNYMYFFSCYTMLSKFHSSILTEQENWKGRLPYIWNVHSQCVTDLYQLYLDAFFFLTPSRCRNDKVVSFQM